jgi:glutaredoxin
MSPLNAVKKEAVIFRMVTSQKMCVHGLKAKDLLQRKGYRVTDNHLTSPEEIAAFKSKHGVQTVPQIFIDDTRVGGFDDLQHFFGIGNRRQDETTYTPVIVLFIIAAAFAFNAILIAQLDVSLTRFLELFISSAMVLLGLQKLQDIDRFATMFLSYDLLAQRWVRYAYFYPFIECGAGILMMTGTLTIISAPITLVAASIGAISVFKAVYVDKRELKCACVGGDSKVPLGFVSLLENVMMVLMAIWMLTNL